MNRLFSVTSLTATHITSEIPDVDLALEYFPNSLLAIIERKIRQEIKPGL